MSLPLLKDEGEFIVTIKERKLIEAKKDNDPNRFAILCPCEVAPSPKYPEGAQIDFILYLSPTLIKTGHNAGKPLWEIAAKQCEDLGFCEKFSPERINESGHVEAMLVMAEDTYNGVTKIKPAYLNPIWKKPLSIEEANNIWKKMTGASLNTTQGFNTTPVSSAPSTEPEDDFPL